MNIKDLKVGDAIYIREDLEVGKRYGSAYFTEYMKQGVQRIMAINSAEEDFNIVSKTDSFRCRYTTEMVDWEKTRGLKINESWERINESWESVKKAIKGDGTFKEITQFGESGNEITKAIGCDGKEIIVKNNNEENDVEKAVMLLMLKQQGFTYSDIKREVEKVKVKWIPKLYEECYTILGSCIVMRTSFSTNREDAERLSIGNYFKTREEAERKAEEIKKVLKGEE